MDVRNPTYAKRALAASKTVLVDEMSLCLKDFSALKIREKKNSTHALCEPCDIVLCGDHLEIDFPSETFRKMFNLTQIIFQNHYFQ